MESVVDIDCSGPACGPIQILRGNISLHHGHGQRPRDRLSRRTAIMNNKKLIVIPLVAACGGNTRDPSEAGLRPLRCRVPEQGGAYADGIPYQGYSRRRGNSDVIAYARALGAYVESWFSLQDGLTQPNTFSPDGSVLYVTTAKLDPEGQCMRCAQTPGTSSRCSSHFPTVALGSIEVMQRVISTSPRRAVFTRSTHPVMSAGPYPWSTRRASSTSPGASTSHSDGHVATVTSSGTVYLVAREDGAVLSSLSTPEVYGFVEADGFNLDIDQSAILPQGVLNSSRSTTRQRIHGCRHLDAARRAAPLRQHRRHRTERQYLRDRWRTGRRHRRTGPDQCEWVSRQSIA